MSIPRTLEALEELRRSGLRIDREGVFWHEGAPVTHHGLRAALWRWLDRLPAEDGRYILRLDEQRFVYLDVDDAPLVVRSLRWDGRRAIAVLNDSSEEPVDFATLTVRATGRYLLVRRGLEARWSPGAWNGLGSHLSEHDGAVWVDAEGGPFQIPDAT